MKKEYLQYYVKQICVLAGLLSLVSFGSTVQRSVQGQAESVTFNCTLTIDLPQAECEGLIALYEQTGGVQWHNSTGWREEDIALCDWYGVTCENGYVTQLDLTDNNIVGILPPEIGNFVTLDELELGDNHLSEISAEIGNLTTLRKLDLRNNELVTLPSEIGQLTSLEKLYLNANQLNSLPTEITELLNLKTLYLSKNQLKELPLEIARLSQLESLYLGDNLLQAVPAGIIHLFSLRKLYLGTNQISSLSSGIVNLQGLETLDMSNNSLDSLPPEITKLTGLKELYIRENLLTALPAGMINLNDLEILDIRENQLAEFPLEIVKLTSLHSLYLGTNQISSLSFEIFNLQHLNVLDISYNQFVEFPIEIISLTNLDTLDLSGNQLTDLPLEIASLSNLSTLDLSSNQMTRLPAAIGNLHDLTRLALNNNQLETIAPVLHNTTKLRELHLYGNHIGGMIPTWFVNLPNLTRLDLGANQLTGTIPIELANLTNLASLNLYRNQLSGAVPLALTKLTSLKSISLDYNQLVVENEAAEDEQIHDFLAARRNYPIWESINQFSGATSEWEKTQTTTPTDLKLMPLDNGYILLEWKPIDYTKNNGHYEIEYAISPVGPFLAYQPIEDKLSHSYHATGLESSTIYFFRIRTYTAPHGEAGWTWQQNGLWSDYSELSSATTVEATPTPTFTPTDTPTDTPTPTSTYTPSATSTPTPTFTPTFTPTDTPLPTATPTPTDTPTDTPTSTSTFIPTATPTNTPTATSTNTPSPTKTDTPTHTPNPIITATPTVTISTVMISTVTPTATPAAPSTKTWTLLIYAVGDNDLHRYLSDSNADGMLARLRNAGPMPNVQVGILYDGPSIGDTYQYILTEGGQWNPLAQQEARMDEQQTLQDFLTWGHDTFQSDYYALALLDHANGVVGFGQDLSSDATGQAFLTPGEIRSAILHNIDTWNRPLDVLHMDGCSFGLFENTSIVDDLADYMVASPNTSWGTFAYDEYRRIAGKSATPADLAQRIAGYYADELQEVGYPYTISVFNMAYYDILKEKIHDLGTALKVYVTGSPGVRVTELRNTVRSQAQKYDSGNYRIEEKDHFVDLGHLAHLLSLYSDSTIAAAAQAVVTAVPEFVEYSRYSSGQFEAPNGSLVDMNLEESQGVGIFYPYSKDTGGKALRDYADDTLFPRLTQAWGWANFLRESIPPLSIPNGSLEEEVLLAPLTSGLYERSIYLPWLSK